MRAAEAIVHSALFCIRVGNPVFPQSDAAEAEAVVGAPIVKVADL